MNGIDFRKSSIDGVIWAYIPELYSVAEDD